jgi:reactive intermediate/imine deaminase
MRHGVLALALLACGSTPTRAPMKHINPPTLAAPRGYTHVVEATGGRTIYISGQVPLDSNGALVGDGDLAAQTTQVFENLRSALAAAGASFADVAKITVFMTDVSRIDEFRGVRDRYITGQPPASSLVEVSRLFRPGILTEIEAIAIVP